MSRFAEEPAFRLAVELTGAGHHPGTADLSEGGAYPAVEGWFDLNAPAHARDDTRVVRVRARDLGAAQRLTAQVKATATDGGRPPGRVEVLVDLAVMIAEDAATARARLARLDGRLGQPWGSPSLSYVGTPAGLAGLLADMRAVDVADGVTLQPMSMPEVLGHIAFETLPQLESLGLRLAGAQVRYLRELGSRWCAGEVRAWRECLSA
ncbi:hypothetical protein ABZ511_07040 [Nocardia gamkensis]|uniref:hypothetical protein n=1 Tax=Nocardia gamkensis TaxID=352869 RepID=UPI0033CD29EE